MTRRSAPPAVQNEANPETAQAPAAPDKFHGQGGCYRIVDGVRVLDADYGENGGRTKIPGEAGLRHEPEADEAAGDQPAAE